MTSPSPVLVSAIVSTFNAARFIRGCIEDLEGQTISDKIEIIIVDSASEQNEGEIVREFQERYPNIHYTRTEKRECVYAAWNRGIRMAIGKYITNANADDRHRTNAFARMSQVLEMRPEIALAYADVYKTETENETFEGRTETGRYRWYDWDRHLLLNQGCFMGPQPMWRRSVHDLYGYFDESLVTSGDYEFWLRISQTFDFHHIREPLGLYLVNPDSIEHRNHVLKNAEDARILSLYRGAASNGEIVRSRYAVKTAERPNTGDKDMLPVEEVYEAMQPVLLASRPGDAVRALQNIVRSFPEFARAHSDLGTLYYQSGEKQKAIAHYERAATISPENVDFQKNLADYYYVEMARAEEALKLYSKVLQARPNDVETLMTAGHILVSLQRFEEADAYYRTVLEIEPWNPAANENHHKLSQMGRGGNGSRKAEDMYAEVTRLLDLGDQAGARRQLEKMLGVCPHFALAHNDLGVLCYQAGEKEKALRYYEEAVRLQPDNHTFQKNLGDFYWVEQSRTEDALRIYVRILEAHPEDIETLMALARVCDSLSRREDARTFYERVLEIEPWNTDAQKAMKELQRGFQSISPGASPSPQDLYDEAARLISAGDTASGKDRLLKLVTLYPEFALAHNDLGVLAYQAGEKQEALERYRKAAQLETSNMTFQKNLADCYWIGFDRLDDALKIYVDIMTAHPEDVETLLATGKICLALRQPKDARVFFDRVLEIEPWNAEAHQQFEQLEASSRAA